MICLLLLLLLLLLLNLFLGVIVSTVYVLDVYNRLDKYWRVFSLFFSYR